MPDRREEILENISERFELNDHPGFIVISRSEIYNAMDENGRQMCLELLEYVAKKASNFWIDDNGEAKFRLSGDEELTAKQLFENFL